MQILDFCFGLLGDSREFEKYNMPSNFGRAGNSLM